MHQLRNLCESIKVDRHNSTLCGPDPSMISFSKVCYIPRGCPRCSLSTIFVFATREQAIVGFPRRNSSSPANSPLDHDQPPLKVHKPASMSRSFTGCTRCKARRQKCDEQRPVCGRCQTAGAQCKYAMQLQWGGRAFSRSRFGACVGSGNMQRLGMLGSPVEEYRD